MRFPASVRRRYERLRSFPAGLLVVRRRDLLVQPDLRAGHDGRRRARRSRCATASRAASATSRGRFFAPPAPRSTTPGSCRSAPTSRCPRSPGRGPRACALVNAYLRRLRATAEHDPAVAGAFIAVVGMRRAPTARCCAPRSPRPRRARPAPASLERAGRRGAPRASCASAASHAAARGRAAGRAPRRSSSCTATPARAPTGSRCSPPPAAAGARWPGTPRGSAARTRRPGSRRPSTAHAAVRRPRARRARDRARPPRRPRLRRRLGPALGGRRARPLRQRGPARHRRAARLSLARARAALAHAARRRAAHGRSDPPSAFASLLRRGNPRALPRRVRRPHVRRLRPRDAARGARALPLGGGCPDPGAGSPRCSPRSTARRSRCGATAIRTSASSTPSASGSRSRGGRADPEGAGHWPFVDVRPKSRRRCSRTSTASGRWRPGRRRATSRRWRERGRRTSGGGGNRTPNSALQRPCVPVSTTPPGVLKGSQEVARMRVRDATAATVAALMSTVSPTSADSRPRARRRSAHRPRRSGRGPARRG